MLDVVARVFLLIRPEQINIMITVSGIVQVVRSVAPVVDKKLHPKMLSLLPAIFSCVRHEHAAVRLVASRCITSMARVMTEPVMAEVLKLGVPMLGDITSVEARQGAGMLVTSLVDGLGPELIAYAPLLIVPLLGCMSDSNLLVRQSVTNSFAALVPLLPLARGVPAPGGLDECQVSKSAEDARFLDQLLDNSQVEDYKLTVPIKATLRRCEFLSIAMCLSWDCMTSSCICNSSYIFSGCF